MKACILKINRMPRTTFTYKPETVEGIKENLGENKEKNNSKSELGKDEVKCGMKTKIFEIKRMLRQQGDLIKPI